MPVLKLNHVMKGAPGDIIRDSLELHTQMEQPCKIEQIESSPYYCSVTFIDKRQPGPGAPSSNMV